MTTVENFGWTLASKNVTDDRTNTSLSTVPNSKIFFISEIENFNDAR